MVRRMSSVSTQASARDLCSFTRDSGVTRRPQMVHRILSACHLPHILHAKAESTRTRTSDSLSIASLTANTYGTTLHSSHSHNREQTMARKSKNGVNVSEAIRKFLKANSGVGPTEAAATISKEIGQKVSSNYVSNIKNTLNGAPKKKGRKGRKPGPKPGRVAVAAGAS